MSIRTPEQVIPVENRNQQRAELLRVLKVLLIGHFHRVGRVADTTGKDLYRGEKLVADDGMVTARHYHDTSPDQPGAVCSRDVHYEERDASGSKIGSGKVAIICHGCPECPIGRRKKR